jgi:hypothetical protein
LWQWIVERSCFRSCIARDMAATTGHGAAACGGVRVWGAVAERVSCPAYGNDNQARCHNNEHTRRDAWREDLLLIDLQRIAHFVDLTDLVIDAENGLRPIHHLVVHVVVLAVLGDAVPVGAVEQRLAQCFVVGAFLEGGEILCLLSIQE